MGTVSAPYLPLFPMFFCSGHSIHLEAQGRGIAKLLLQLLPQFIKKETLRSWKASHIFLQMQQALYLECSFLVPITLRTSGFEKWEFCSVLFAACVLPSSVSQVAERKDVTEDLNYRARTTQNTYFKQ